MTHPYASGKIVVVDVPYNCSINHPDAVVDLLKKLRDCVGSFNSMNLIAKYVEQFSKDFEEHLNAYIEETKQKI